MSVVVPFPTRRGHDPWLKKPQIAAYFDVSERTIERWTKNGMPCFRANPGRVVRYRASECESWLAGSTA